MHTGYDNFWMYQNIRHEPVLSLSKSDSYSNAVLTDNYKPLPNGGYSNHLNSYLTPQNSVASSHQSNQSRMTNSQCMWPSSVHPTTTYRSTYANNFQSPETYYSQSANLNCSAQNSQVQQNTDSGHLRNTNLNFSQMLTDTGKNNYGRNSAKCQNINNNDMANSRIRVKDVFSLNNNTLGNSLFENNLGQTYQREQTEHALNCATTNNSTSYGLKTATEYMNYEKINLCQSNQTCPPYRYSAPQQTKPYDYQKFFQQPNLFHQQNMQASVESQLQFNNGKELEKNLPSKTSNNNSMIRLLSNPQEIWKADVQNTQRSSGDALYKSKRVKVQPKRNSIELSNLKNPKTVCSYVSTEKTNKVHCSDSLKANERITHETSKINSDVRSQSNCQETISKTNEKSSLNQVSLTGELRKCKKSSQCVPSDPEYSENRILQENNLIKITIPHTGQSSFLRINEPSCIDRSSNLSLSCLLESNNQVLCKSLNSKGFDYNHPETENNRVINSSLNQVNQGSSINSKIVPPKTNPVSSNPSLIQNNCNVETEKFDHSVPSSVILSKKISESSNENLLSKEQVGVNNSKNCVSYNSGPHSENTLKNVNSKLPVDEKSKSTETISHNDTISKAVVIKQENIDSSLETLDEQFIPKDRLSPHMIKIKNRTEYFFLPEFKPEPPNSENRLSGDTSLSKVNDTENIDLSKANGEDVFYINKPEPRSKVMSNASENSENKFQEFFLSGDNSGKEKTNSAQNKIETTENKVEEKKVYQSNGNYKSQINREKLDLLIDFLKKDDEEVVEIDTSKKIKSSDYFKKNHFINKQNKEQNKEVHLTRNRRKLNKTSIVKNKNNSREMISLMSHKVSRVETMKCSSRSPRFVPAIKDLDKNEERFEESSSMTDRNVDFSENCDKINNHFQKSQTRQEDCLKSELKMLNTSVGKQEQDASKNCLLEKKSGVQEEDNISNIMRTFQSLKTHFCMSCELISPVDSFWINVVSGELRCLNCFKKMMIRTDEHISKPNLEETTVNINSVTNLAQKNDTNQESKTGKENMPEPEFENKSESCNGLIRIAEIEYDNQKSNDLQESIKQDLKEIINESSKNKFTIKNDGDKGVMSEFHKANAINFSNTSRRQSISVEYNISLLEKTAEEQNKLGEESLHESEKNVKSKENIAHNSSVLENASEQEVTERYEKSKRKTSTEYNEVANKIQNSDTKDSPIKCNQLNTLKEKSSGSKTFPLNQSNKDGKNTFKESSVSPKSKLLETYKEESLSDRSMSKSDFKQSCDTNKTQILKEGTKLELTDKSEKSSKKNTAKKEIISNEPTKVESTKPTDSPNQNKKKTDVKEEFTCQKLQISEEHLKKEIRILNSLDECVIKTCSKGNCTRQKNHCSEDIVRERNTKRNTKNERLDKLKIQNVSNEICFDLKPKISEQTKIKEMDIADNSKNKSLASETFSEKHKSVKWVDRSRKRKNMEGNFGAHKVRVLEEQANKGKKLMTHSSVSSEGNNAYSKSIALELEKQNAKVFKPKPGKSSSLTDECRNSGSSLKKETNQTLDSSEKSKRKDYLSDQKAKTSEPSKRQKIDSRGKAKNEYVSSKPIATKNHSKNEIKKLKELPHDLRKNSTSKEDSGSVSKHFKIESSTTEIKENKTAKVSEKTHFREKITERSRTSTDVNTNEDLRSLNNGTEDLLNVVVKKEQHTKMKKEFPNKYSERESFKNERRNSNKEENKTEAVAVKKEKEAFRQQSDTKARREIASDLRERKDRKSELQDLDEQNPKGKTAERRSEKKAENVAAEEFLPNVNGSEKTVLLTKLIKKTKKLSLTLLNAVP